MRRLAVIVVVVCVMCACLCVFAQEITFRLEPVADGFSLQLQPDFGAPFGTESDRGFEFKKEPEYKGANVKRGVIRFGEGAAKPIGYAWEWGENVNTIHIDANRNGDLADDGDNAFPGGGREFYPSFFKDIRVPSAANASSPDYVFDLGMDPFMQVTVRSGWRGDVELDGQKWRMEVADNLDGAIGEGDWFLVYKGDKHPRNPVNVSAIKDLFPRQSKIALNGKVYALTFRFVEGKALEVLFKGEPALVAEVTLEGQFVRYLWLDGPGLTALVDTPESQFLLPVANYTVKGVLLEGDSEDAMYCVPEDMNLTVSENTPAKLKAGGPLQNTVTVTRRGNTLQMGYTLKGAGGEEYRPIRSQEKPIWVVARQGDKTIGSGLIEYG